MRRRRFDEAVGGHRRRPVRAGAVGWLRVGLARRDQPGRRRDLEDQAEPLLVDAGDLGQPLDVAHAEPAAAQLGNRCGAEGFEHQLDLAQQVDHRPGGHRVDVGDGRGRHHRIGWRQLERARAARRAAPDRPAAAGSPSRRPPGAAGRPPAAAAPAGPAGCRARRRGCGRSASPRAAGSAGRAAPRRARPAARRSRRRSGRVARGWPGPDTRAGPRRPRRPPAPSASPQTSPRSRRSSTAAVTASSPARSPISASSLASGTAAVSACSTSSASSTASRRKSRSSVAALTDWRACARAASAAIVPGGGWVRSGRNSSSRISRSSGSSASQAPSGTPGVFRSLLTSVKQPPDARHRARRLPECARG